MQQQTGRPGQTRVVSGFSTSQARFFQGGPHWCWIIQIPRLSASFHYMYGKTICVLLRVLLFAWSDNKSNIFASNKLLIGAEIDPWIYFI